MTKLLATQLKLSRCPHCRVDSPSLGCVANLEPTSFDGVKRYWRIYVCSRCAGAISALAPYWEQEVTATYSASQDVSEDLPLRARANLDQALNSLSSPAGAVMLAASAVDSMLKAKGLLEGSLFSRIDNAAKQHLITEEMAQWAHDVRLDANDQRHSDEKVPLPDSEQGKKCVEFATALGQFIFVLPARVERGLKDAKRETGGE